MERARCWAGPAVQAFLPQLVVQFCSAHSSLQSFRITESLMTSAKTLKIKSTYYLIGNLLTLEGKKWILKIATDSIQMYPQPPVSPYIGPNNIMDKCLHNFKIQIILKIFNSILMRERKVVFCQLWWHML